MTRRPILAGAMALLLAACPPTRGGPGSGHIKPDVIVEAFAIGAMDDGRGHVAMEFQVSPSSCVYNMQARISDHVVARGFEEGPGRGSGGFVCQAFVRRRVLGATGATCNEGTDQVLFCTQQTVVGGRCRYTFAVLARHVCQLELGLLTIRHSPMAVVGALDLQAFTASLPR